MKFDGDRLEPFCVRPATLPVQPLGTWPAHHQVRLRLAHRPWKLEGAPAASWADFFFLRPSDHIVLAS